VPARGTGRQGVLANLSTPAIDRREKPGGPVEAALDLFSSIKLSVCLLIGLAATSIVGTVIPQNEDPAAYIERYGQAKYDFFHMLQLTDMYHSWWFVSLLALLITNLLICSIRRLPTTLKAMSPPGYKIDEGFFAKQHEHASFHTALAPAEAAEKVAPLIRSHFSAKAAPLWLLAVIAGLVGVFGGLVVAPEQWTVLTAVGIMETIVVGSELVRRARTPLPERGTAEGGQGVVLYAEKGRVSRLGVYVVHASIILIMTGAIMGLMWGVRGGVRIGEGDTLDYFWLRNPKQKVTLPFAVRVDRFNVSFYNTGQPKEFKSTVTIIDKGREVLHQAVLVNSPLGYGGYRFYQSDYGPIGFSLMARPKAGGQAVKLEVPDGNQPVPLPGGGTVSVAGTQEDLVGMGPAIRLHEERPGRQPADFWIFSRQPDFDKERGGDLVYWADMRYYSGFEVARDPGVWVVWGGCTLMVMGFLVAFFMSHRRLWLRVVASKGGKSLVQVGGRTNKNRPGFELEFAALSEALKGELQ
jgi:cytochrome c biogenesis protein